MKNKLAEILTNILSKVLTEKMLVSIFLILAKKLVKSTKNDIDDAVLEQLEDAFKE